MIPPVRCFNCGKLIASKYKKYIELRDKDFKKNNYVSNQDENIDHEHIFKELSIKRYCCKRMLLTHVNIIDELS